MDGGGGGGKRPKVDTSNIHVIMDLAAKKLLEYRLEALTTPTATEQAYAAAILGKMQNYSVVASILDRNGETKEYTMKINMKAKSGGIFSWKIGNVLKDKTTLKKKRWHLRAELYRVSKGNISEMASILSPKDMFKNFMESDGIRGKKNLQEVIETSMSPANADDAGIDKEIVDNIKSLLSIEAHQLKGDNNGGSRPDGVQHYLNGLICAASSEISSVQSRIAKRLGLSQHSMEKGKKDRLEVSAGEADKLHRYCKPFERSERGDKYDDIAHQ